MCASQHHNITACTLLVLGAGLMHASVGVDGFDIWNHHRASVGMDTGAPRRNPSLVPVGSGRNRGLPRCGLLTMLAQRM